MNLPSITMDAQNYLQEICLDRNKKFVRYALDGGGCAGFISKWEFDEGVKNNDIVIPLGNGTSLLIDKYTIEHLEEGTKIDYTGDFMPSLKVTVPNTVDCGCGSSFTKTR